MREGGKEEGRERASGTEVRKQGGRKGVRAGRRPGGRESNGERVRERERERGKGKIGREREIKVAIEMKTGMDRLVEL